MYTEFYQLEEKPFQISSDPKYLWLGEKHKEALATLKYGVLDNKGFLLLTGDVGTGKTTLIHSLIESLSDDIIYASVPDPALPKQDFFNFISMEFGIEQRFETKGDFLVRFREFLLSAYDDEKKVLLIIDEAQLMTQELLEEIRLLSNIEKTHTKLINIFFVGQNEFNESLKLPQNRAVRQRLTLNYNIDPLTPKETANYVKYRLKIAGAKDEIFEPEALQQIFIYSGGFPRRINILCDHALLSGYVKEVKTIDMGIVRECAKELKLPAQAKLIPDDNPESAAPVGGAGQPRTVTLPGQFISPGAASPRQVVIQAAPFDQPASQKTGKMIALFAAGIVVIIVLMLWLLFPEKLARIKQGIPESSTATSHLMLNREKSPADIPVKPVVQPVPQKEPVVDENIAAGPIENPVEQVSVPQATPQKTIEPEPSEPIRPLPREKVVIRFRHNSNDFSDEGFSTLRMFSEALVGHPDAKVRIIGHTDSEGYQKYNIKLSEFRANIVRSYLLGKGALPEQLEVVGKGSLEPIASNDTPTGRMMNRRVEIEVVSR